MDLTRLVAAHAIRFIAASQSTVALLLHGAWLLLAAATSTTGGGEAPVARAFLKLFAFLGGIGPDGHGDESHVVQAMALLTVPVYVIAAIRARRDAPRPPFVRALVRWAMVSGGVAFAGFSFAFVRGGGLSTGEIVWLALLFATIAAGATAWAYAADRVGDLLVARIEGGTPAEPARRGM